MTPEMLAQQLNMDYPALKRALHRMDIVCGKDEAMSQDDLAAVIQQQSEPHHKRPESVVAAAKELGYKLGVFSAEEEDSDGVVQPAPSATPPSLKPKKTKPAIPQEEPIPHPPVSTPQQDGAASAASPAWRTVAYNAGKTVAVATLIAFQAFIFASLTMRVVNGENSSVHLQFWFAFVAAFLIESAGVMIVSRYKVPEGAGEWTKRDIESSINQWLIPFMIFQVMVDCSYIGLFYSWSDIIGQWLVALAIPVGIFTYSHLYFNRN